MRAAIARWIAPRYGSVPAAGQYRGNIVVNGNTAQLMDTTTYEVFELSIPEELMKDAAAGKEADLMCAMDRKVITRIH